MINMLLNIIFRHNELCSVNTKKALSLDLCNKISFITMKKIFCAIALITGLSLVIMSQDDPSTYTKVGDVAPTFIFKTIEGKEFNTAINFFATWCPPCKKELPVLQKNIKEKYSNNSDFVLVVVGREHSTLPVC